METERIKTGIYRWGIYPALFLLREMQDKELYEDCLIIKQAIDDIIQGREWYLNTQVDDNELKATYGKIMQGHSKSNIIHSNMPRYIDEFRRYIQAQ